MREIEKHFENLSKFLLGCGVPTWDRELFAEDLYVDHLSKRTIDRHKLYELLEFSDRFDFLLHKGYDWLNLSGLGLHGGTLIVAIEKPLSTRDCPRTSVNLSGPLHCVEENDFCLKKYIEIKYQ